MTRARAHAARVMSQPGAALALELAALGLIVLDFVRIVAGLIALDSPLHWDEAVYAVRARSWVDPDVPLSGWSYIRPPLLPLLAGLPVLAGGDEWQLRTIGLLAGVALLMASWWLGRMLAGPIAGLLAAGVLHGSPTLQKEAATLLTDVPAAALIVVVTGLLWHAFEERPRPGLALVAAAGLGGAAFLIRYGSLLGLVPLVAVALVLWWRPLRANLPATSAALGVTAAVVLGHVAWSLTQTGAPLGILADARTVVSDDPAGLSPFREYQRYLPFTLAGSVGSEAMRLGMVSLPAFAIAGAFLPGWRRALRAAILLVVPAGAQIYLLTQGIGHAEERFFLASAALLVTAGAVAVTLLVRPMPWIVRAGLLVGVVAVLLMARGPSVEHSLERTVQTARYYARFEAAALAIAEAAGPDCGIVGGGDPVLAWYSRCETDRLRLPGDGGAPGQNLDASERWAVLLGDPDRLEGPVATAVIAHASAEPLVITDPETGEVIASAWLLDS